MRVQAGGGGEGGEAKLITRAQVSQLPYTIRLAMEDDASC